MNLHVRPLSKLAEFSTTVSRHVAEGARFAALIASAEGDATRLLAILSLRGGLLLEQCVVPTGDDRYPSLAPGVPAARWYQREIADLFGVSSDDGALGEALVYPFADGAQRPRLGNLTLTPRAQFDPRPPPTHVLGEGVFTLSYGPVRSGVFESIEYVIETPGEDIPYVGTRISYKHRGVEKRFEGMSVDDGVLLAERSEGVASVAHALAFCGAVEQIGDITISLQAGFVRVMHAELERISNHLDSTIRHVEAAGQAVAYARFSLHKERVQRLRGRLCGSRFGRGVVVPGGVSGPPLISASQLRGDIDSLEAAIASDTRLLLSTPSFLDRLRGTGVLSRETVVNYGALGPLARGSGVLEDVRYARPYAAYGHLGHGLVEVKGEGDALARLRVRVQEIEGAFGLLRRAAEELDERGELPGALWSNTVPPVSGEAIGWAEAPQGEVLTWVEMRDGRLVRVKPRSASFHNLALFPMAFPNDILTDFAFIEASFGLSVAGAAS
jgi:Ni,Fe-hydrogenase III large subunit